MLVAEAEDELELRRELDLVLDVAGGDIEPAVIVAAGRDLPPDHVGAVDPRRRRPSRRWSGPRRHCRGPGRSPRCGHCRCPGGRIRRRPAACARCRRSRNRALRSVWLIRFSRARRVVIGLDLDDRARGVAAGGQAGRVGHRRGVDEAGEDVLVEFVVIGVAGPVAQGDAAAEIVRDVEIGGVGVGEGRAVVRIAEEFAAARVERLHRAGEAGRPELRGNAAVGDAVVPEMLVAELDQGVRPDPERGGRVEPPALVIDAVAIAAAVLVDAGRRAARPYRSPGRRNRRCRG